MARIRRSVQATLVGVRAVSQAARAKKNNTRRPALLTEKLSLNSQIMSKIVEVIRGTNTMTIVKLIAL